MANTSLPKTKDSSSRKGTSNTSRGALGFVGAGATATALARAARDAGLAVSGFVSRTPGSARAAAQRVGRGAKAFPSTRALLAKSDLIFVAVPDRAVEEVARRLAADLRPRTVVAHFCGALGSEALASCRARGAQVAAFHPMQTFPDRRGGAARVPGTFVSVEGDRAAVRRLETFARRIGMRPFRLGSSDRALYHASAVLASNAVVALFDLAAETLAASTTLGSKKAARALLPLVAGTTENLRSLGLPAALSGPVARGDEATVRRQLAALDKSGPAGAAAVYRALSLRAVALGRRKGTLDAKAAARIEKLLSWPASGPRRLHP